MAGFSLIEILVAFTILAFSLGAIYQVFISGSRAAAISGDYARALVHAETALAEFAVTRPFDGAPQEGTFDDGFRWRIDVEPYTEAEGEVPLGTPALDPILIRVTVSFGGVKGLSERNIQLTTVRLKVPAG